jgi:hypothetical protein
MNSELADYLRNTNKLFREETQAGTGDHSTMLKDVVIKDKAKPIVEYSANLNGPGAADQCVERYLIKPGRKAA